MQNHAYNILRTTECANFTSLLISVDDNKIIDIKIW